MSTPQNPFRTYPLRCRSRSSSTATVVGWMQFGSFVAWRRSASFDLQIAMGMSSRVLAPNEVAPLRHMYVISRGLVLYGGRVLSQNMACKKEPVSKGGLALSYIFAPKS